MLALPSFAMPMGATNGIWFGSNIFQCGFSHSLLVCSQLALPQTLASQFIVAYQAGSFSL